MLTDALIELFNETPGILLATEAAEELAENVQAAVIRHLFSSPNKAALEITPNQALSRAIEDVWVSEFGIKLFNLYTVGPDFPGKKNVPFSNRRAVVLAMIRFMLLEQERQLTAESAPVDTEQGDTLRRRLRSLNS